MHIQKTLCAAILAAFTFHANASVITLQTGYSTAASQTTAAGYKTVVEAALKTQAQTPKAGYGSKIVASYDSLSNQGTFGANSNIAWKSTIDFGVTAAQAGNWNFRTGVDFDNGGALFLDGIALTSSAANMYWGGSYSNATQYLQGSLNLAAGNHTLTIYGLEQCCDGASQAQFKIGSSAVYTSFASTDGLNLKTGAVPEPATLASFGLGIAALAGVRRRKQKRD
jgi:hypothetical protein